MDLCGHLQLDVGLPICAQLHYTPTDNFGYFFYLFLFLIHRDRQRKEIDESRQYYLYVRMLHRLASAFLVKPPLSSYRVTTAVALGSIGHCPALCSLIPPTVCVYNSIYLKFELRSILF